jgi:predicted ATPase/DNA-binding SARP family transcriptional activator/peroxiredoxin
MIEFAILGPLEVRLDGQRLELGGQKQRALLCALLLESNRPIAPERLLEALWEDGPTPSARKALQGYVSRIRKLLGPERVQKTASGYLLRVGEGELDVDRCRQLCGEGRHAEALSLWRGTALADFADQRFAQVEISRLEELRLTCLEDRIESDLTFGRHRELVGDLQALVAEHPHRQRLRAGLMLALYRSGRHAEALEAYQHTRKLLVGELGIEPSKELQDLHRAILNQDSALASAPRNKPRGEMGALPVAANPLIGRQVELRALGDLLLGHARLVTLTGAGGCGKTRLALEVATAFRDEFEDRVGFVSLGPLRRPEQLSTTIMSALNLAQTAGETALEAVRRFFRDTTSLVVLDNFEHLLPAASVLAELLSSCPHLKLLVTSRGSLHLSGEHEFPLDPLPAADAIALLRERAHAVRPDFRGDETVLAAICARFDCLPLALELAAPHLRLLSEHDLLGRIDRRLELLRNGPRDLAARQQTLRATIAWSYDLLGRDEQRLFARLAVFTGGCTLEAAERVCGATLGLVESLVDKNLLRRRELVGETRFWMLETVREYALERLEAEHAVEGACGAYADYYLALARQQVSHVDHGQLDALHALERDLDNFLAAFAWSHGPENVPTPVDDGACKHLLGVTIASLVLESSQGPLDLAELAAERLVLYIYPGTTRPGRPPLPGLYALPGGRGCTAESRAFRDHAAELAALGAKVAGLSVQTLDDQLEFAERAEMPFPLIADPERQLETTLRAATFEIDGKTLYRRVTLIVEHGTITKVFYPVFPPDRNATDVVRWLSAHPGHHRTRRSSTTI